MFSIYLNLGCIRPRDSSFTVCQAEHIPEESCISILSEICEYLQGCNGIDFVISGFGQENWRLDIATDLLVVLEQFPVVLPLIKKEQFRFELDLYEQGVERKLVFYGQGEMVSVKCIGYGQWQPNFETEIVTREFVCGQFLGVYGGFCGIVDLYLPEYSSSKLFWEWKRKCLEGGMVS